MSETKPFDQHEYRLPSQGWTEQEQPQHGGGINVANLSGEALRIAADAGRGDNTEPVITAPEANPDFLEIKSPMDRILQMRSEASQYAGVE